MSGSKQESSIGIQRLQELMPRITPFRPRELYTSQVVMANENLTLAEVLALQAVACAWAQAAQAECDYWTDVLVQMQPPN